MRVLLTIGEPGCIGVSQLANVRKMAEGRPWNSRIGGALLSFGYS